MTRIFPTLALLSLTLFGAALVMGLMIGDLYDHPDQATRWLKGVHLLTGAAAAIGVVFVHSIAVTYFVGTSRWIKEVSETYRLDPGPLVRCTLLKRRTFPWCVAGMLTVVVVGALGAASDPGTGRPDTESMANVHLISVFLGLTFVCWSYFRVWLNMGENQEIIEEILGMVRSIRQERGLDQEKEDEGSSAEKSSELAKN
jgi:hypothetical protein